MATISPSLQANAAALVIGQITGLQPDVSTASDGAKVVSFSTDKALDAADGLNAFLNSLQRGGSKTNTDPVRYDLTNVVLPVILRQALPWLVGAAALGWLLSDWTRKEKGKA